MKKGQMPQGKAKQEQSPRRSKPSTPREGNVPSKIQNYERLVADQSPRRREDHPGSAAASSPRTPPSRTTMRSEMGESPRRGMGTTMESSSTSSGATAHFGVTTEGIPYKTSKPLHESRIVEERSPSLKRGKNGDDDSYSPSKRRDQSPTPQNER
eukprot:4380199-Prorocentrum_lima.AAC.1